jgi:hypothetical protein
LTTYATHAVQCVVSFSCISFDLRCKGNSTCVSAVFQCSAC